MNTATLSPAGRLSLQVLAAFAGIYVIWGTTYLAIAVSIQTLPPFVSGALRFLTAGALMYAWLRARQARPFAGIDLRVAALCGVLLSGIGNGLVIWAEQGIPSGIAALIVAAVPVVVLVFDWAFFARRAPSRQALVGIALAIAGVALVVMHTSSLSGRAEPLYVIAMIAAVVGWSFGTLLQKRAATPATVLGFTCAQMLAGGVFQLVVATLAGEWARFDPAQVSGASWLAMLYLVGFGSIVALNCYLWLLTRVSAQKVTTYALVNPVVALILGAAILGERITLLSVVAAALVLLGVALVLFRDLASLPLDRAPWLRRLRARGDRLSRQLRGRRLRDADGCEECP